MSPGQSTPGYGGHAAASRVETASRCARRPGDRLRPGRPGARLVEWKASLFARALNCRWGLPDSDGQDARCTLELQGISVERVTGAQFPALIEGFG